MPEQTWGMLSSEKEGSAPWRVRDELGRKKGLELIFGEYA